MCTAIALSVLASIGAYLVGWHWLSGFVAGVAVGAACAVVISYLQEIDDIIGEDAGDHI